jgi:hypothetical protein
MIRQETRLGMWLFTQQAHAYLCGQIAQFWDEPIIPELIFAAYNHDAGWLERDADLQFNEEGKPRTFTELELDDHFAVWRRSIQRNREASLYAGLMVSMHAVNLYERRLKGGDDSPADQQRIRDFIEKQQADQQQFIEDMNLYYGKLVKKESLEQNLSRLQAWDWLSLLVCMGEPRPPHSLRAGDKTLTVELDPQGVLHVAPWPFTVNPLELTLQGRFMTPVVDAAQLIRLYHAAPLQFQSVQLVPGA